MYLRPNILTKRHAQFKHDALNTATREYMEERKAMDVTSAVLELFEMQKTLGTLREQHNKLLMRSKRMEEANVQVISGPLEDDTAGDGECVRSHTLARTAGHQQSRDNVIATLTWEDLVTKARSLADTALDDRMNIIREIELGRRYPETLAPTIAITPNMQEEYMSRPAVAYYGDLVPALAERIREAQEPLQRLDRSKELGIFVEVLPSQWFIDFLHVFYRAKRIGPVTYPRTINLNDKLYQEYKITLVDTHTKIGTPTTKKSYTIDTPYHLSLFGSLLTNTKFVPMEKERDVMSTAIYSDIELLVDYAVRASEDLDYDHFQRDPYAFFTGTRYQNLLHAVDQAVRDLVQSMGSKYKLMATPHGVKVIEVKVAEDKSGVSGYKKDGPVPARIMAVLRTLIEDNMRLYNRTAAIAAYKGLRAETIGGDNNRILGTSFKYIPRGHIRMSPIGRLLNFDINAVSDFSKLYNMSGIQAEKLRMSVVSGIDMLPCVQKVYVQLLMAAVAVHTITIGQLTTTHTTYSWKKMTTSSKTVLETCTRLNHETKTVQYMSSLEGFPGSIFLSMLADNSEDRKLADLSHNTIEPYMSHQDYFAKVKAREHFFNLFGAYVTMIPTIAEAKLAQSVPGMAGVLTPNKDDRVATNEGIYSEVDKNFRGIRWMSPDRMDQLRASTGADIYVILASHINKAIVRMADSTFYREDIIPYFMAKPVESEAITTPLKVYENYYNAELGLVNFMSNPIVYYSRTNMVEPKSEKMPIGSGHASVYPILPSLQAPAALMSISPNLFISGARDDDGDPTQYL
ncbi:PREDICTED: uncharacterized protein LOC109473502 [Branchiostoma belcheri]|uniref:Uncharacterized protein LOC109473502 n=1 Tax=Branchiostoma belcheri TaxID=7741 RepID=A0A6P4ZH27_BRABE|nr:PREDICTED: uncharacterized protein LOC109473502 [Branchiostoma belcheri]